MVRLSRDRPVRAGLATLVAVGGLTLPGLTAAASAPIRFDQLTGRDAGHLVTMLLMRPSTGLQAGVTLYCAIGGAAVREDLPNVNVSRGGSFAYAGPADLSRAGKLSHVASRLSGVVSYAGSRLTLGSITASTLTFASAAGCGRYSGTVTVQTRVR